MSVTLYSNSLWQRITAVAEKYPTKHALIEARARLTFSEFTHRVDQLAIALKAQGVKAGDRILFLERPTIRGMCIFFAVYRVGAVVVIADPAMGNENLAGRVRASGAVWTVLDPTLALILKLPGAMKVLRLCGYAIPDIGRTLPTTITLPNMPKERGEVVVEKNIPRETDALIVFTSGTTSLPKGVVHTFNSLQSTLDLIIREISPHADSIFYSSQLHFVIIALLTGSTACIETRTFTPSRFFSAIRTYTPTHIFLLPTEGSLLLRSNRKQNIQLPKGIRTIIFGSAPVLTGFLHNFKKIIGSDTEVLCIYGGTEMLPIAITTLTEKLSYDSAGDYLGKPLAGVTVDIRDGEITARGNNLCRTYLDQADELSELRTGDLGFITDSGGLVLTGRKKDMIIRRNHNIYPTLFESTISNISNVRACALVGVYDEKQQDERIVLFIEKETAESDTVTIGRVQGALRSGPYSIDTYALPDIITCRTLPVSGRSQKIDKNALRVLARNLI